ncbi:ABC transporter ATP-binding protein [Candidatus Fermentibacteria bacterium]|nr:ABC transporter ATP-binding protein [Candidatus Fermentibacteria bacterium]
MQALPALEVYGVSKRYGRLQALHPLDLIIPRGAVFALLGSNGAGKTTFMKAVLGLVSADSGRAVINGVEHARPASRRGVRYFPETVRFGSWATPEFMHSQIERIRRESTREDLLSRATQLGCADLLGRPFGRMSHGQTRRAALAIATSGRPSMLFLDEPSNGLDPEGRILVRELLRQMAASGTTIVINSHLLGEVEAVCSMAAFLCRGRVVASGSLDTLLRYKGSARIESPMAGALAERLSGSGYEAASTGPVVTVPLPEGRTFAALTAEVAGSGIPFTLIELARENLEELFLRLVHSDEEGSG